MALFEKDGFDGLVGGVAEDDAMSSDAEPIVARQVRFECADIAALMAQVARVLRPGGRFVFSTTHPVRWAFPDVPGESGLVAPTSYWDRTPYVETDGSGRATYAEHHRTLGDRIREIVSAGLVLEDLVEPQWPERNEQEWGGWSPTRGRVIPGTAIFVCRLPG